MRHSVEVRRDIRAGAADVWRALTDPRHVRRWFGDVDRLVPGRPFRCDFGDGDFFAGRTVQIGDGRELQLEWRFMDVGPWFDIHYQLETRAPGSVTVTVNDTGAPTAAEAESLREGWTDFLGRLDGFVTTGATTRFAWNPVIALGAFLPADPRGLFSPAWRHAHFGGAAVALRDRAGGGLTVDFHDPEWSDRHVSTATVEIHPMDGSTAYVAIRHAGWEQLPEGRRLADRRRYAAAWQSALSALETIVAVT